MTLTEFVVAFSLGVIVGAYPVLFYYQGWRTFFNGTRPMKLRTTIIFAVIITMMMAGGTAMQLLDPKFQPKWTDYTYMGWTVLFVFHAWMSVLATWMDQYDTQRETAVRPGHDQTARDRDRTLGPPHCRQE